MKQLFKDMRNLDKKQVIEVGGRKGITNCP